MNPSGLVSALKNHNYRLWVAGAAISNIGTWMQRTAQDWLVLTELTRHSASAVGFVMALQFAPPILLLPWIGLAADYFDKRRMLIVTQLSMAALSLALGVLILMHAARLWQVDIFALLFGCASAFDAPVRQAFVAEVVGDADLSNAVALNSTSFNAARIIGPAVSGLLIGAAGTGWSFVLNGLSFVTMLLALCFMRVEELRASDRIGKIRGNMLEGFYYVRQNTNLGLILVMLALIGTFGLNFPIFIPTMSVRVFHTGARGYGLLSSCMAVGTMSGALLSALRSRPSFVVLLAGTGIFGLGCSLSALAPTYWFLAGALALTGLAILTFTTTSTSLLQLGVAPAMRGRVMALRFAVSAGGTPIGAPIIGWVADRFGPRCALGLAAASGFAAALIAMFAILKRFDTSKEIP